MRVSDIKAHLVNYFNLNKENIGKTKQFFKNHLAVFRKVQKVNLKSPKKAQNHHILNHILNLVNPVTLVLHTNQIRKVKKLRILLY